MGNKSKGERREAHARFEQRLAAKAAPSNKNDIPPVEQIRLAASFTMTKDPVLAMTGTAMTEKALDLVVKGRIDPNIQQSRAIVTTARAMGWTPPEVP